MVSTVRSLEWQQVCFRTSSALVCHGTSMLMNLCSPWGHPEGVFIFQFKAWKAGMENKGLRVNMMQQLHQALAEQAVGPQEVQLHHWSTGSRPKLHLSQVWWENSAHRQQTSDSSECRRYHALCGATFCYLGDMLCSGSVSDSAIAIGARCCVAWRKSRKVEWTIFYHLPSSPRHLSPQVRGMVYMAQLRPFGYAPW